MKRDGDGMAKIPWSIPSDVQVAWVNGYPMAYRDAGNGAPLILVHGSLNDYRGWARQVPDLARKFRVIVPSLRHYYPEPWNGQGGSFSLSTHADDLAAFIRSLGLGKVHLLGHSRGGAVALKLACQHQHLLRSLILAEPRGLEDLLGDRPGSDEMATQSDAIFAALHQNLATVGEVAAARAFVDAFSGPGSWDRRTDDEKAALLSNIATAVDSGERPGITCSDVADLACPVLLLRGASGARRYSEGFEAMRACNASIPPAVSIPDAGHGMHRDNPGAFNEIVSGYLLGIDSGAMPMQARPQIGG